MAYARCARETYDHLDRIVADKLLLAERKGLMPRFDRSDGLEGFFRFEQLGLLDEHTLIEVHRPSGSSYTLNWDPQSKQLHEGGRQLPVEQVLTGAPYTIHPNWTHVRDQIARLRQKG